MENGGRVLPFFCVQRAAAGYSFRTTRQGLPTATTFSGISFVTTLPAPMTLLLPMLTPGKTQTLPPIQTLLPTAIGRAVSIPRLRSAAASGWAAV